MVLVILIPMAGGLLLFLLGRRQSEWLGVGTALATLAAALALTRSLWQEGPQLHAIGGWGAPLGINLYADGLSMVMLLLTAVVGLLVSVYSTAYFRSFEPPAAWQESDAFWPAWLLLWSTLNALYLSADLFNLYVVLELVTLSAVALTTLSGGADALRAALRYLLAAITGSMAYLLGVALTYAEYHALDLHTLTRVVQPGATAGLALTLMTVGLLLKTALFPLHFWLPPAHSVARAPVSAVLSGLVVKGSFYMLLRLWFEVFTPTITVAAGQLLGMLGALAIFWGSFQAIRQEKLKPLIAHSTVGQIGYLFLLFPLTAAQPGSRAVPWFVETWTGGVYQAVSHGLAKASMFLAAGVILQAMGSDRLSAMRDIAGRLPVVTFALGLSGMSLMGLPPSGGFVAKWMLLKAIIASGQWWWLPVMVGGSLLTAGYVFLLLRHTFVPAGRHSELQPVSWIMQISALTLALASVALGFRLEEPLALLRIGTLFPAAEIPPPLP